MIFDLLVEDYKMEAIIGRAAEKKTLAEMLVTSTGIEPVSGASETLILSIVLRGLNAGFNVFFKLPSST